jgi:flagellin-like protein
MWATKRQNWRKKNKRGVSPIIATILLVAITVVLAAVLYVLISGLVKGPGNTPIGSAFGMSAPVSVITCATGSTLALKGCTAGDYAYAVTITSASSGVTLSSINLAVMTSTGAVDQYATGATGGGFAVTNIAGATLADTAVAQTTPMSSSSWTYVAPGTASTQLTTSMTIWVDLGLTPVPSGTELTLVVYGVGSYSGSVSVVLP